MGTAWFCFSLRARHKSFSAFDMAVLLLPVSHFLASYWSSVLLQLYCCTFCHYFKEEWRADYIYCRSNVRTHVQACMSVCESQSLHSSQVLQFSRKSAIILSSLLPICYCRLFYSGYYKCSPLPWIVWAMSEPGDSQSCEMSSNIWVCWKSTAFKCKTRVMADWKENYCTCGRSFNCLF